MTAIPRKRESKYDVAKDFSSGFAAALLPSPRSLSESDHWISGWDVGYGFRKQKNAELNKYLVSIGHNPMHVIGTCSTAEDEKVTPPPRGA